MYWRGSVPIWWLTKSSRDESLAWRQLCACHNGRWRQTSPLTCSYTTSETLVIMLLDFVTLVESHLGKRCLCFWYLYLLSVIACCLLHGECGKHNVMCPRRSMSVSRINKPDDGPKYNNMTPMSFALWTPILSKCVYEPVPDCSWNICVDGEGDGKTCGNEPDGNCWWPVN